MVARAVYKQEHFQCNTSVCTLQNTQRVCVLGDIIWFLTVTDDLVAHSCDHVKPSRPDTHTYTHHQQQHYMAECALQHSHRAIRQQTACVCVHVM